MADSEKRNSTARIPPRSEHAQGVGGRQPGTPPRLEGGGYLNICTDLESPVGRARADARLDELRAMGLSGVWRDIAEKLGFESFLVLWQLLDQASRESQQWNHKGNIRLNMPSFKRFLRYQRNLWIQELDERGYNTKEIRARVRQETGEDIGPDAVRRIIKEAQ